MAVRVDGAGRVMAGGQSVEVALQNRLPGAGDGSIGGPGRIGGGPGQIAEGGTPRGEQLPDLGRTGHQPEGPPIRGGRHALPDQPAHQVLVLAREAHLPGHGRVPILQGFEGEEVNMRGHGHENRESPTDDGCRQGRRKTDTSPKR